MSTFESNMGLAKVQYPRIIINRPAYFILWIGLTILFLALTVYLGKYWIAVFALPCVAALAVYKSRLKGLFYDCDVNIGKVLSRKESLYAVAMNLNDGMPERVAVKIAKGGIPPVQGFDHTEGAYVPIICYPNYKKKPGEADKIFTIPYAAGTANADKHQFQQDHIRPQIADFERYLAQVPQPYQVGLYIF